MGKVKITANNWKSTEQDIERFLTLQLRRWAAPYVRDHLYSLLQNKQQSDRNTQGYGDSPMPKKAASTIRQYKRKGWDTEHYLIRTGKSHKINFKNIKNGVRLRPRNYRVYRGGKDYRNITIGFHDDGGNPRQEALIKTSQALSRRPEKTVTWFRLNFGSRQHILRVLRKNLRRYLDQRY